MTRLPSEISLRADAPGHRRVDLGESEIEARRPRRRLRAEKVAARRLQGIPALLQNLLGDVAGAAERCGALVVALRKGDASLRRGHGGFGLIERRLVGPLVDREEQIADLDDRAVAERDRLSR